MLFTVSTTARPEPTAAAMPLEIELPSVPCKSGPAPVEEPIAILALESEPVDPRL